MKIFTKDMDNIENDYNKINKWKLKMAGCFDFRHKASSDYQDIISGGTFSRLGKKMMRSRSDPDISPSKKTATNANKVSSKSSPAALQGHAPRRRFVRVVRGSSNDDDLCNPHVKRKTSDTSPPKKIDYEALNRRYFSDSDSDSDSQHKRDILRARSEERSSSPVVSSHEQLRKGLSLDVEIPKRTHFNEQVDVIGIDKKGKQVYTAMEKIQFDNFETCDIRYESNQDVCPVSDFDVLESISETPELAKSPPRLLEGMDKVNIELEKRKVEDRAIVKMHMVSGHSIDIDEDKENQDEKHSSSEMPSDVNSGANPECLSQVDRDTQSESDCRPRASSMDQKRKAFRMFGRLLRSTSDTLTKLGSPKGSPRNSPNQLRRQHKYVRILRDSDHGDEYYNPHVIRRSSASRLSRSVNNISIEDQLVLRPILRKHHSLDIPDKHTHFQENVEVVEFDKKQKCVELTSVQHVQMDQLKSDSETDSVDEIPDDVFVMSGDSSNTDPGVSSDGSTEDVSKIGTGDGP